MLAVPSSTPGIVTKSITWRNRCLRHRLVGVRFSSFIGCPLAATCSSHNRHTSHISHLSSDTHTPPFVTEP